MESSNKVIVSENLSNDEFYNADGNELLQKFKSASSTGEAPTYTIPSRKLSAVEIPAIVNDVDRAVSAFGRAPSLEHVRRHHS